MTETLIRIVYCSRAQLEPGREEADIRSILEVSRRNNAAAGITGMLLFTSNSFAQALEGPQAAVEATFERIQCDPRHRDALVLKITQITERAFAGWSMGYCGRADTLAALALERAFEVTPEQTDMRALGAEVLAVLRDIVSRESDWA